MPGSKRAAAESHTRLITLMKIQSPLAQGRNSNGLTVTFFTCLHKKGPALTSHTQTQTDTQGIKGHGKHAEPQRTLGASQVSCPSC